MVVVVDVSMAQDGGSGGGSQHRTQKKKGTVWVCDQMICVPESRSPPFISIYFTTFNIESTFVISPKHLSQCQLSHEESYFLSNHIGAKQQQTWMSFGAQVIF